MRFSTKTRYGLRFLLRLAREGRVVTLAEIARQEKISLGYLEQIVSALKPLGLFRAERGSQGGYVLIKEPAEINLLQVFERLEGLNLVACLEDESHCERAKNCLTRSFWQDFGEHIRIYLASKTLQHMLDRQ
ncbi:MAG: Rrf2 family transcriptional regulator [Desulfovibrio sp.]|nr:Rrf2 family transcriptional regulator [Desulfovibrio sp.]